MRVWVKGNCEVCGEPFRRLCQQKKPAKCCSASCDRKRADSIRLQRLRSEYVDEKMVVSAIKNPAKRISRQEELFRKACRFAGAKLP